MFGPVGTVIGGDSCGIFGRAWLLVENWALDGEALGGAHVGEAAAYHTANTVASMFAK